MLIDKLKQSSGERSGFQDSLLTATGLYQRLVTAPRNPTARFTTTVEIDAEKDLRGISASNVCAERAFLAALLRRIDEASPMVIVVDKYFGRDACPQDDPGTAALLDAVAAIRQKRPLVVGRRARNLEPGSGDGSFLEPALSFGPEGAASREEGIVNIADDNRRLALQWFVYPDRNGAGGGGQRVAIDTLALTAAKLFDPDVLQKDPVLEGLIARGEQPFIGFLKVDQIVKFGHRYASELMCPGAVGKNLDWRSCDGRKRSAVPRIGPVVLVGENDADRDEHVSVVGRLSGFYLQANYIEAILDARLYKPAGVFAEYGLAFLFLLALELILILYRHDPVRAVASIAGLLGGAGLLLYLIIIHSSIYIDPVPITLTAVLIKVLHIVFDSVRPSTPDGAAAPH